METHLVRGPLVFLVCKLLGHGYDDNHRQRALIMKDVEDGEAHTYESKNTAVGSLDGR